MWYTPTDSDRCALYRHYDAAGVLLYVGITRDPATRTEEHIRSSRWVRFASIGTVQWLDSRSAAESAERVAIRSERPLFNGSHSEVPEQDRAAYLALHGAQDLAPTPERTGWTNLDRQPVGGVPTPTGRVRTANQRVHVTRWWRGPQQYRGREAWEVFSACGHAGGLHAYHTMVFVPDETAATCKVCVKVPGVTR